MFIVFEGVDGSGKSTLAQELAKALNYDYTHEPTFTSEQADNLNLSSKDDIQREIEFAVDRIKHVQQISNTNIVCDRYIWTGLTYCHVYNPSAYPFAKALYDHDFFPKPDLYVFVDTPIEICYDRRKVQTIDHLTKLRSAYLVHKMKIEERSKVLIIEGTGDISERVKDIVKYISNNL